MSKVDLRPRCQHCKTMPRGMVAIAGYKRYAPYCSYNCQEMGRMAENMRMVREMLKREG